MEYIDKILYKVAMVLLVVGALNWLTVGVAGLNMVSGLFGTGVVSRMLYVIVGLAAVYVLWRRDFYLPFLGDAVLPCVAIEDRSPPGATRTITIAVAPESKVLYWAAEPALEELKTIKDWKAAYARFENAGVTTAGKDGIAYLKVRNPQAYSVPMIGGLWSKTISPHVHYRVCGGDGMMSRVETVFVDSKGVEGFENMESQAASAGEAPASAPAPGEKKKEEAGFIAASEIDMNMIGAPYIVEVLKSINQ
jgi:uncharacterized membrane protein YuzA (DUF378 family)